MKKLSDEKLKKLEGGIISMETYCDVWTSRAFEAIQWDDDGTRNDLLYIAMHHMAAGKCENVFTNY
jgi:hypothetical protein